MRKTYQGALPGSLRQSYQKKSKSKGTYKESQETEEDDMNDQSRMDDDHDISILNEVDNSMRQAKTPIKSGQGKSRYNHE